MTMLTTAQLAPPERLPFDVHHVLATPSRSDRVQERYFVIAQLEDLMSLITPQTIDAAYDAHDGEAHV